MVAENSSIREKVKERFSVELPRSLAESIDTALSRGTISIERVMTSLETALHAQESEGLKWYDGNGDGLAGSFKRNAGTIGPGDLLIRKGHRLGEPAYRAFLVIDQGNERFLGEGQDLESLQDRARRYLQGNALAVSLRNDLLNGVSVNRALKTLQKDAVQGIDI